MSSDIIWSADLYLGEGMQVLEATETCNGYSWTLVSRLADMLQKSQNLYGPRDNSYTVLGIEFEENGPQIWYPFGSEYIAIQLSKGSMSDMVCGCYELAHESIHLLSPLGKRGANVLEEGLATRFALDYVQNEFGHTQTVKLQSYADAVDLVDKLLAIDGESIKKVRAVEPVISRFTDSLLVKKYPKIDPVLAAELCSPFVRSTT